MFPRIKLHFIRSHPSRVRGLKYQIDLPKNTQYKVAPLAGAWIEIWSDANILKSFGVAPLAGAWIEIRKLEKTLGMVEQSHPSRVRGLKFNLLVTQFHA